MFDIKTLRYLTYFVTPLDELIPEGVTMAIELNQAGQIYEGKLGRRGTYFRDPNGHLMEILTPAA